MQHSMTNAPETAQYECWPKKSHSDWPTEASQALLTAWRPITGGFTNDSIAERSAVHDVCRTGLAALAGFILFAVVGFSVRSTPTHPRSPENHRVNRKLNLSERIRAAGGGAGLHDTGPRHTFNYVKLIAWYRCFFVISLLLLLFFCFFSRETRPRFLGALEPRPLHPF